MPPGAGPAVRRLYGCSPRQAVASLALLLLFVAGAVFLHRLALIALFAAILLPALTACLALLALARLAGPKLGWLHAWIALAAATAAGTAAALPLYRTWTAALDLQQLPDLQLVACAFGIGTAMLGLPLWHSHTQARAAQIADLRQAAQAAELKALQAQIEPHFLYNTLANTRYLARTEPERAVQMLEHLIAWLHGALPDMRSQASTLGREFELAGHYLALMAIRFGARLSYRLDCPPALAGCAMPPLLLMTLVENAVRHGLEPTPGPVRIALDARRQDGMLRIAVADDGAGLTGAPPAPGGGVGLHNLRQRLQALYGPDARFSLARTDAGMTEAVLVLPLDREMEMAA
ncbi:histidine kinase [Massilia sp. YIM B02763]|uniref:sensor histidine kinase n=1 Tax=Massilia sp. YIM B02763 TaxID=3050130 RepID=UPI0025B72748|nr:histidine kinase [Massilia sp. YIM B02763]MDN4055238.1 histidine kinase [Massilia sp. YIM B02763]